MRCVVELPSRFGEVDTITSPVASLDDFDFGLREELLDGQRKLPLRDVTIADIEDLFPFDGLGTVDGSGKVFNAVLDVNEGTDAFRLVDFDGSAEGSVLDPLVRDDVEASPAAETVDGGVAEDDVTVGVRLDVPFSDNFGFGVDALGVEFGGLVGKVAGHTVGATRT